MVDRVRSLESWLLVLPYLAFPCLALGYGGLLRHRFFSAASVASDAAVQDAAAWALLIAGIGGLLLQIGAIALATDRLRRSALIPLVVASVIYAVGALVAETVIPFQFPMLTGPGEGYSDFELRLQRLLSRSGRSIEWVHGKEPVRTRFNSRGWPAPDHPGPPRGRRIVFIGDSFLQVSPTSDLAQRVERELRLTHPDIEIVNLSQSETGIDDYRFRLMELATLYQPDEVYVFLYEANDVSVEYRHQAFDVPEPWRHIGRRPTFRVSDRALRLMRAHRHLNAQVLAQLAQLQDTGQQFRGIAQLKTALASSNLSNEDLEYVYLACLAYEQPDDHPGAPGSSILDRALPNTTYQLMRLWMAIARTGHGDNDDPPTAATARTAPGDWPAILRTQLKRVYQLPPERRLDEIARLAASYAGSTNPEPFRQAMARLPPYFASELLVEPNPAFYIWLALKKYVLDEPREVEPLSADQSRRFALAHLATLAEMHAFAARQGFKLTFVAIPEASHIDDRFVEFWRPLLDFRILTARHHAIMADLTTELASRFDLINLAEHQAEFQGAYWPLDGHWNENGNARAAAIVASSIVAGQPPEP